MSAGQGARPPLVVLMVEMFCRGGGAEGQISMLAEGLVATGLATEIWSYKAPPSDLVPAPMAGVKARIIPGHDRGAVSFIWRLRRELQAAGVDLLHTWMSSANFYGRLAATLCGDLPILCAERTSRKPPMEQRVDRLLSPLASAMVVNSTGVGAYLRDVVGVRRVPMHLIPNGVDTSRFRPGPENPAWRRRLGIARDALVLGTIGRHIPDKRQDWIIRAVAAARAAGLDVHGIMAGWGSERDNLAAECRRAGIQDRVHLVGVTRDPAELLRSYQLFVLPSRREGMPNAALEAMASGVPVVATEVAGIHELMGQDPSRPCGEVVPVEDEDAFQAAVRKYLTQEPLRRLAGGHGRQRAVDLFSAPAMVAAYVSLYGELMGHRRVRALA